jgi:hypothetical protein
MQRAEIANETLNLGRIPKRDRKSEGPRLNGADQSRKATDWTDVMSKRLRQRMFLHIMTSSLRSM